MLCILHRYDYRKSKLWEKAVLTASIVSSWWQWSVYDICTCLSSRIVILVWHSSINSACICRCLTVSLRRSNTDLKLLGLPKLLLVLLLILLHISMCVRLLLETAHWISILVISSSCSSCISGYTWVYSRHVGHTTSTSATHIIWLIIGSARHHFQPPIGLANFFHVDLLFKNIN
jgi:hypothetical protein